MAGVDLKDRMSHSGRHCAAYASRKKHLNTVVCYGGGGGKLEMSAKFCSVNFMVKEPLGRPSQRWGDNIKTNFRIITCWVAYWIEFGVCPLFSGGWYFSFLFLRI
jgi:hypothetical protein